MTNVRGGIKAGVYLTRAQCELFGQMAVARINELQRLRNKTFMAYGPGPDWEHWLEKIGNANAAECGVLQEAVDTIDVAMVVFK